MKSNTIKLTKEHRLEATKGACMSHEKYVNHWKKKSNFYNWFTGYHGEAGYFQFLGKKYTYTHYVNTGDGGLDGKDFQIKTITKEDAPLSIKVDDNCLKNKKVKYIVLVYFPEDKHGTEVVIKCKITVKDFKNKATPISFKEKDGSVTKKLYITQNKLTSCLS